MFRIQLTPTFQAHKYIMESPREICSRPEISLKVDYL